MYGEQRKVPETAKEVLVLTVIILLSLIIDIIIDNKIMVIGSTGFPSFLPPSLHSLLLPFLPSLTPFLPPSSFL